MDIMSVQIESHSTLCCTYRVLCILVRQPITEVKAEWNAEADVREIEAFGCLDLGKSCQLKYCFIDKYIPKSRLNSTVTVHLYLCHSRSRSSGDLIT